jgi:multiple antibiotic resistance protein
MPDAGVPLSVLAPLLFTLMGPIAAMPLFAAATAGADRALQRRIALKAYLIALITLAIAVFVGAGVLGGWGVDRSSLIIAAGLILTITALRSIFGAGHGGDEKSAAAPSEALAISPIAIPGLVTPMSVAVLVIFVSYFPAAGDKLAVMAVAAAVMTLNLGAMLGAHWFMRTVGPSPLIVLGGIFGVLQAAMGVETLISGLLRSPLWA